MEGCTKRIVQQRLQKWECEWNGKRTTEEMKGAIGIKAGGAYEVVSYKDGRV